MVTSSFPVRDAPTDSDLLKRWAAGHAHAGSRLIARHFVAVRRYIRSRATSDVDDLTQETFLICLRNAPKFRGDSDVRTFLVGIAHHLILATRRAHVKDDLRGKHWMECTEHVQSDREDARFLKDAFERLSPDLSTVLMLSYWGGLTESEIAQSLDCSRGTIASRIRRGKEQLRELLQAPFPRRKR